MPIQRRTVVARGRPQTLQRTEAPASAAPQDRAEPFVRDHALPSVASAHAPSHSNLPATTGKTSVVALRLEQKAKPGEPLRAFVVVEGKLTQVSFSAFTPSAVKAPGPYAAVSKEQINKAFTTAKAVRERAVQDLASATMQTPAAAEDGSQRIAAFHMSFGAMDQAGSRYVEQMALIGAVEGFRVVVRTDADTGKYLMRSLPKEARANVTLVPTEVFGDQWAEDHGVIHLDRSVSVPAAMPAGTNVADEILRARLKRFHPRVDLSKIAGLEGLRSVLKKYPDAAFSTLGAVELYPNRQAMLSVGLSAGVDVRVAFACIEEGNCLSGALPSGEPYCLIGRDSVAITRHVLARDLGRTPSDDEIKLAIGKDKGTDPKNVIFVEQPGDFHLDMAMAPIAPGAILVNDALAAFALEEKWLREDREKDKPKPPKAGAPAKRVEAYRSDLSFWESLGKDLEERIKSLRTFAERRARLELKSVRDLEAAGLTVHRMAASSNGHPQWNFVNAEQGKGKDGARFLIALGADPRAEQCYRAHIAKIAPDVARLYFLDRATTPTTLAAMGGISCRAKAEAAP